MTRGLEIEWRTLGLILFVIAAWMGLLLAAEHLTYYVAFPLAAAILTLHSSLQHEVCHGHPTRNSWLNETLVYLPLGLFVPYRRFKALHLRHHNNELLTDPYDDPESFYLAWADWTSLPHPLRFVLTLNNTLAGRLIIGPAVSMVGFYGSEIRLIMANAKGVRAAWLHHTAGTVLVIWFVTEAAGLPLWLYVTCAAYPGMSLLMLRTFAEHRAHETAEARSIIVEFCPVFSLLFLNNNLHVVHHAYPGVAWYQLPALYRRRKAEWHNRNQRYVYPSYLALARSYFFRVKEPVAHPLYRQPVAEDKNKLSA